jgi:hypothetical protein
MIEGTRAQVWHGTADRTSGGLTKNDLTKNKHGYIVSKKKSEYMKKNPNKNPLKDYLQESESGEFGAINPDSESKSSTNSSKELKKSKNLKKSKQLKKSKKNNRTNPGLLNTLKQIFY